MTRIAMEAADPGAACAVCALIPRATAAVVRLRGLSVCARHADAHLVGVLQLQVREVTP